MPETPAKPSRIAFIGFGEAATAFVSGWGEGRPEEIAAYDVKTDHAVTRDAMRDRYRDHRVAGSDDPAGALAGAEAVFCVVTADRAVEAARAAAGWIPEGAFWFDCNSCSPGSKRAAAEVLEDVGARYVDVAVMAPVHPKKHKVPLLVSGPHAAEACAVLQALDMSPKEAGTAVGEASSVKMLRSVMIKGLEALMAECFLAARRAGVEERVLASLMASDPEVEWARRATYNLERMMVHGTRRAAEMREVAVTVTELGLPNLMAEATSRWQDIVADTGAEPGEAEFIGRLDRVLSKL
ncbi:DUF1932 domain-containing protein [Rhodobacterales bacterium HKCCE2091]|nr:DUF1932 domain-containing protein [Rhodobacterales bacterium HKCCE2091]